MNHVEPEEETLDPENCQLIIPNEVVRLTRLQRFFPTLAFLSVPLSVMDGVILLIRFHGKGGIVTASLCFASAALAGLLGAAWWQLFKTLNEFRYVHDRYRHHFFMDQARIADESERARKAAAVRHAANRQRKEDARQFYLLKKFPNKAAAARGMADRFHIEPKVAERWIREWEKSENLAPQGR